MKETLLEVLMYLYHNYLHKEHIAPHDLDLLIIELERAGVILNRIQNRLNEKELDNQTVLIPGFNPTDDTTRHYSDTEMMKLDTKCRGFIMSLEQIGLINAPLREAIIQHAMNLETQSVSKEELKWLIYAIIKNTNPDNLNLIWLEDFLFSTHLRQLH